MKSKVSNVLYYLLLATVITGCQGSLTEDSGTDYTKYGGTDHMSQFVGTWTTDGCIQTSTYRVSGSDTLVKRTVVIARESYSVANLKLTDTVYALGTGCTGTPRTTVIRTGENTGKGSISATELTSSYGKNLATYVGEANIEGVSGAAKVNMTLSPLLSGFYGGSGGVTAGGITYPSSSSKETTLKVVFYLDGTQLKWVEGTTDYPTSLTGAIAYNKQP